jgi:hypothetical protein
MRIAISSQRKTTIRSILKGFCGASERYNISGSQRGRLEGRGNIHSHSRKLGTGTTNETWIRLGRTRPQSASVWNERELDCSQRGVQRYFRRAERGRHRAAAGHHKESGASSLDNIYDNTRCRYIRRDITIKDKLAYFSLYYFNWAIFSYSELGGGLPRRP